MSDGDHTKPKLSPVGALAREFDADRFYAALFAPAKRREALFALIAFNYEIARLREVVSEPLIGEMRLVWWREALEEIEAGSAPRAHPVVQALDAAQRAAPFSLDPLRRMIDARTFDQHNDPMPDLPALTAYARATGGALAQAMAEALLPAGDHAPVLAAAQSAGTAWALTGIVRSLRIHASRGQLFLPARDLGARGISAETVFAGVASDGLLAVINDIIAQARAEFDAARKTHAGAALPAVLYCVQLPAYWRRMLHADFDPFRTPIEQSDFARLSRLSVAALLKRI